MSGLKQWYSAAELAAMKLPGIPTSKKGMIDLATRDSWSNKKRSGRGGGLEYQPPKSVMKLIEAIALHTHLDSLPKTAIVTTDTAPSITSSPALSVLTIGGLTRRVRGEEQLNDKDRARRDASLILCRAIEAAMAVTDCSVKRAITALAPHILQGIAHPELIAAAHITYTKPRAGGQRAQ